MKIEWLVTNVTGIRSPDRAEHAIWELFWRGLLWQIQAVFVVGGPLCDVGTPSRALIILLRGIY